MQPENLPIGYWIKLSDELLTKGINNIQSANGVTRTAWQILNAIHTGEHVDKAALSHLMQPFADAQMLDDIILKYEAENLLREDNSGFSLTEKGLEVYKKCADTQQVFREKSMAGIPRADYQVAVLTLKKIVDNLSGMDE